MLKSAYFVGTDHGGYFGGSDAAIPVDPTGSGQTLIRLPSTTTPPRVDSTLPLSTASNLTVARSNIFNIVQTFFVDSAAVQGAPTVSLTAIDLFFKGRPNPTLNASGIINPGVSVSICEVESGLPVLTKEFVQIARLGYDEIFAVSDASVASTFGFSRPIVLPTDRYYGIVIRFEDSDYSMWSNKRGDAIIGTNSPSPGSTGSRDGSYFLNANTSNLIPQTDVDLKYRVKIAKYDIGSAVTVDLVNNAYEFLTIDTLNGTFVGGEDLFVASNVQTGTLNIQSGNTLVNGNGTTLTSLNIGDKFIIQSGGTYGVAVVDSVANTTQMFLSTPMKFSNTTAAFYTGPIGKLGRASYITGKMKLSDSTATAAIKFVGGSTIRGATSNTTGNIVSVDNLTVDEFVSHLNIVTQSQTTVVPTYDMATANATSFLVDGVYDALPQDTLVNVPNNGGLILSRSNEVSQSYLYSAKERSASVKVAIGSSNMFVSPTIEQASADLTVRHLLVGNTTSHMSANVDTEVGPNGKSPCKHFCNKMTFEASRQAEDLRVFASCYRPANTEVRMYAKIHNSVDNEPFDDKPWTPLEIKNNRSTVYSSSEALQLVEYEFGLPLAPESNEILVGSFTTTNGSSTITGFGTADLTTKVVAGSKIKLYSPLFPTTNYIVATVVSATSTTITIGQNVTDANVTGNGMAVDVLKYNVAFSNKSNSFITRYYDSSGGFYDKFNTVQLKIVLQTNKTNVIPRVSQVEVVGVSA